MGLQAGDEKLGETRHGPEEQPESRGRAAGRSANQREQVHVLKAAAALPSWWPLQPPFFSLHTLTGKGMAGCPSPEANNPERRRPETLVQVT